MTTSVALALGGGFVLFLAVGWWMAPRIQAARLRELFDLQRKRLEPRFLGCARATGLPRGLIWESCQFHDSWLLARDRRSRQWVAFVEVTVTFSALPESDMVDLPAVGQPRQGVAVWSFERGHWVTTGRVIFNHSLEDVRQRYVTQYQFIEPLPLPSREG